MKAQLFRGENEASPLVVLNTFENEGAAVFKAVRSLTDADFSLLEVSGMDWNRDLSPWEAPAVFKNDAPFGGKADDYLKELTETVIPSAVSDLGAAPSAVYIAGYSLAGLFAVYSLFRTSVFSGAASASGSMWFPLFIDFASSHDLTASPSKVYLSLGDREAKTRNPVMATVQDNTEKMAQLFRDRGVDVTYELNPGNHFQEPELRMAKGICGILR
ncbi:MAG: hypothetical protein II903_07205 [Spirochaetales bacterium]|nr:hypothetical protein [Spirochaetales bacterium]